MTSLGIASIGIEPWFLPVVSILLTLGLWGFWKSSKIHNKRWPFLVATVSSIAVIAGRIAGMPSVLWIATATLTISYMGDSIHKKRTIENHSSLVTD